MLQNQRKCSYLCKKSTILNAILKKLLGVGIADLAKGGRTKVLVITRK
jgi:hypothetical protein